MTKTNNEFLKQHFKYQTSLFPNTWQTLEEQNPNIKFQANLLYQEKFLSFNPASINELDENQYTELIFLKILFFNSGIPKEYVIAMLNSNLAKPYCYYIKSLSWDFEKGEWIFLTDVLDEKYEAFLEYKFASDMENIVFGMKEWDLLALQGIVNEALEKITNQK